MVVEGGQNGGFVHGFNTLVIKEAFIYAFFLKGSFIRGGGVNHKDSPFLGASRIPLRAAFEAVRW
jgi:hypothetical protein